MAFAYGDPYLKLPPISQESSAEIDGENSKRNLGIVRDKHGLVRLPPIVRLDSLRSTSSASRLRDETQTATSAENESEMSTSTMKMPNKMESLRLLGRSKKLRKYNDKSEDEMKLIKDAAVKETNEDEARFFDSENVSNEKGKTARCRSGSNAALLAQPANDDLLPFYKNSVFPRRGSSTFQATRKLTRSRRLAKSSPELTNRKINLKLHTDGNVSEHTVSPLAAGFTPAGRSHTLTHVRPQLAVQDIDGSKLSHVQKDVKIEEKTNEQAKRRNYSNQQRKTDVAHLPQSTPSSPICSESTNTEIKQKGRKSLNDITDTEQFVDRRRPSLKKQNLIYDADIDVLKIEGKSCPQNERETQKEGATTEYHGDTLHPPRHDEKRHSLYDLQQILALLQKEDVKKHASATASTPRNTSATSNASDRATGNASVYDLREFLLLAAAEASSAGQLKKTATNKLNANNAQTSASSHLVPPGKDRESSRDERKGSVYDLMEFLSLGAVSETGSGSASENSSRSTSPRVFLSPRGSSSSNDLLSVINRDEESRRSSTYDLMEFLSLPRSGGSSQPDSGPSSPALHENGPRKAESEKSESGNKEKEKRSLSVYDLAEFLSMSSDVPPLVQVTPLDEEQTANGEPVVDSKQSVIKDLHKPRESVYDLREMLGVFQQEHERKRESTYNLQEILSHFQREAEETSQLASSTQPTNSPEKDTSASTTPPKTASSGYSTASDLAPSVDTAKSLDATENSRQMSVYDLKEFLSLYACAAQQNPPPTQQQLSSAILRRKFSGVSQSGVSIHVTDEKNRSIDSEFYEDVFLPVPGAETGASDPSRKRSSIYDLREFLNILNADESPLRRRLSSVSSASSKSSESESESNPTTSALKSDTNSAGSSSGAKEHTSRPELSPRQDSGGSLSLYDLGEFLSLLNTEESPLRRRLSSVSDMMSAQGDKRVRTPVLSRSDSEKGLYSLEEILAVMNDLEQKRINENTSGEFEGNSGEEISIKVPTLPPKTDKTNTQSLPPRKLLQPQRSLNSVPETSEVRTSHSNSL